MNDVELIKSKLNIVDVVREYVPELKKTGRNWSARSPFRSEKTPSFIVNEELGIFKDFGGDKSGDLITFIMEMENLNFHDALKYCANKLGITLSNSGALQKNEQEETLKRTLLEINRFTSELFCYILKDPKLGKLANDYCLGRGIDNEIIQKYKVGYSPTNINLSELIEKKIKLPEIIWAEISNKVSVDYASKFNKILQISGLFTYRNGAWVTKFKDRLMFPIIGLQGEVLGFSGRVVRKGDERPKYINSPETLVYKKSEVLFNFYQAKQEIKRKNFVIITEGQLDAIMSSKAGVSNIVAPLGTSLTVDNVKFLKRYSDNFYLCFDQDDAGTKATKRAYEIITSLGGEVKRISFEGAKDIDELIKSSKDKYLEAIESAEDYILYLLELIKSGSYENDILQKSKKIEELIYLVSLKKSQVIKHEYLKKISLELGIPINELQVSSPSINVNTKRNANNEEFLDEVADKAQVDVNKSASRDFDPKELFLLALVYNYESLNQDFNTLPVDFFGSVENKYIGNIDKVFEDDDLALQISLQRIPEDEEQALKDYIQLKKRLVEAYKKRQIKVKEIETDKLSGDLNEDNIDNNLRDVMNIIKRK